jgi:hypothetical protein
MVKVVMVYLGPYSTASPPAARWFLARLIFDPEDGSDTFFRNVGSHTDYTALYPIFSTTIIQHTPCTYVHNIYKCVNIHLLAGGPRWVAAE